MPVRTRKNRRYAPPASMHWECVFSSEFDFFGELADAGIATDAHGRPDREEARAAWKQYGVEFMASFTDNHTPWALEEFGEPR
ncbi:hypothetical protein J4G48_0020245 [Bradyrhizobium barranii subsp. apii]|uniref:hypothetical protein n=1 Tax=Bradyrhizobium barranii TaxID=2992140 RepID=UPI001AA163F7|nr:hypothetical protein [Bradyrhizobium barranii]UPU00215.1 hypothetical protein J4G48_0020245 [Bradyrhizobium barranii subsp. apii]